MCLTQRSGVPKTWYSDIHPLHPDRNRISGSQYNYRYAFLKLEAEKGGGGGCGSPRWRAILYIESEKANSGVDNTEEEKKKKEYSCRLAALSGEQTFFWPVGMT
jgi:hypothetical protein